MADDVWVITPFRRPTFRKAISYSYPAIEPWDSAPLIVAGGLADAGFNVRFLGLQNIFDAWLPKDDLEILEHMLANPPQVVVFAADDFIASRSTSAVFGMRVVASIIRTSRPDVSLVATGRLATVGASELLSDVPDLTHVVTGEWAEGIGEFVRAIVRGAELPRVSAAPGRPKGASLDALPMPAWELLEESISWFAKVHPEWSGSINVSLRTSAGCKFRCKFCAGVPYWNDYRTKSADRVDQELRSLRLSLGDRARVSFLEDELFTRDPEHAIEIAKVLKQHDVYLDGLYTHSSLLTADVLPALREVTRSVYLGLDNARDDVLKKMGKGQTMGTLLEALERAGDADVPVHLEWIVGTPEEDMDGALENLHAMFVLASSGLVADINTYVFCPHPGTHYSREQSRYDLNIEGNFDEMLESGGYPTASTRYLSREQIFVLYLISQLIVRELEVARHGGFRLVGTSAPNYPELRELLQHFASRD